MTNLGASIGLVASGGRHFAMDFRLTHPLFGQVFRYAGEFEALPDSGGAA